MLINVINFVMYNINDYLKSEDIVKGYQRYIMQIQFLRGRKR